MEEDTGIGLVLFFFFRVGNVRKEVRSFGLYSSPQATVPLLKLLFVKVFAIMFQPLCLLSVT